ncbi:MAG: type II toxin-antitoxin system PemK/MazF family toxin [Clostridiales bacterium]|nr:type II toxin-antitoxin system PemK/MazF family toxin [Clostridiales bacterium]
MNEIKRGEIYYAELSPIVGSEQDGNRPVVILQNDKGNMYSDTTIVAAITSELDKAHLPTHIIFTSDCMKKKSMVLLEQIRTIDKSRLGNFVGAMDTQTMKRIDHAIVISFGLEYLEGLKNE